MDHNGPGPLPVNEVYVTKKNIECTQIELNTHGLIFGQLESVPVSQINDPSWRLFPPIYQTTQKKAHDSAME